MKNLFTSYCVSDCVLMRFFLYRVFLLCLLIDKVDTRRRIFLHCWVCLLIEKVDIWRIIVLCCWFRHECVTALIFFIRLMPNDSCFIFYLFACSCYSSLFFYVIFVLISMLFMLLLCVIFAIVGLWILLIFLVLLFYFVLFLFFVESLLHAVCLEK